ncbi:MAG: metallophosphoesterase [Deltaproteobacteria bacterium]|jgi:hypothetical protein|nr:metallophosphoesterase [Deltaproteobacteria bacterium]
MAPPVGSSKFYLDIYAIKGMILFPSLGTPAIMEADGQLTVFLALHKAAFDMHVKNGGSPEPGSPVPLRLARQFYLQTVVTPWTGRGRDYTSYQNYSNELAQEAANQKRVYMNHEEVDAKYKEKKFGGFFLGKFEIDKEFLAQYHPLGPNDPRPKGPFGVIHKAAVNMCLNGVLTNTKNGGNLNKPPDDSSDAHTPTGAGGGQGGGQAGSQAGSQGGGEPNAAGGSDREGGQGGEQGEDKPTLGDPDPGDPEDVGYRYVFQFTVRESFKLQYQGLYELLFLYVDFNDYEEARKNWQDGGHWLFKSEEDLHVNYLTHPGDELVSESLIHELKARAKKLGCEPIIKPLEFRRHPFMTPDTMKFVKLYSSEPMKVMTQGQKKADGTPDPERGGGEKYLHYLSEDKNCWLVLSRHPVYVTEKDYLDIGVVSDLHLSSRQTGYKVVAPQVIHGAPESDSEFINKLSHQALETSQRVMNSIGAVSDALIVAGDAFDVLRNLDPRILKSTGPSGAPGRPGAATPPVSRDPREDAPKEINMCTADLWEYLDFVKYDKHGPNYPFYIDALMFMVLLLDYCSIIGKPVFYITGNHEGWEVPYGISPRILNNFLIAVRPNAGVPSDQNLTFYEAALLFGKKYSYLGYLSNFDKENMSWAYRWITPWKDCLVDCGKNQNVLLLGWDEDENFILPLLGGGGGLPRAGSAFTENQLSLLRRMAGQRSKFNLLASHFTYANFENNIPLHRQDRERSGTWFGAMEHSDTGSFEKNRPEVYSYLTAGQVKVTVSGHSHRGGAYTCFSDGLIDGLKLPGPKTPGNGVALTQSGRALKSVDPLTQFGGRVACLVSGAGGLYSYQNLNQSKRADIDKPQGLIIKNDSAGNVSKIQYVRDETTKKPRLAVRCDYLWYEDKIEMFFNGPAVKGDIVVEKGHGSGRKYNVFLNPKWLNFLNDEDLKGGGVNPIDNFKLHFVSKSTFRYVKAMDLKFDGTGPSYPLPDRGDVPVYRLLVGPRDVNEALREIAMDGSEDNWWTLLFFLSVHFNQNHPIGSHYDLKSPWCYPVGLGIGSWYISRKFGRGGELPNYGDLGKIPEYRVPSPRR